MNGRDELEQNLAAQLERRAPWPPAGLLDDLLREIDVMPQRRARRPFAAINRFALAAGGALLVVVVIAAMSIRGGTRSIDGTGSHGTPATTATPVMTEITLPVPIREKAIAEQAEQIFADRLRTLGIGNFVSSIGDDIRFEFVLPPGVSRSDVDFVLHRRGDVEWLAWPTDHLHPEEGDPVPNDAHPLFEAAGQVTAVEVKVADGVQPGGVLVTLAPPAAETVATYTAGHVNGTMPIAMDGKILISPTIQGPIEGGQIFITTTADAPISPPALAALLMSGPLPRDWTVVSDRSQPAASP